MNKNKLTLLVVGMALTVGLVGCGQKATVKVTATPPKKVAVQKVKPVTKPTPQKTVIVEKVTNNSAVIVNKSVDNTEVNKLQVNNTTNNKTVTNTVNKNNSTNSTVVNNPTPYTPISTGTTITLSEAYRLGGKADPTEGMKVLNNYKYASNRYYTFELTLTKSTSMLENCVMCVDKNTGKVYRYNSDGTFINYSIINEPDAQQTTVQPTTPKVVAPVTHTSAYIDSNGSLIQIVSKHPTGMSASQALIMAHKLNPYVTAVDSNEYVINNSNFYQFTFCDNNGNDIGADSRLIISASSGKGFKYSVDNTVSEYIK
jgi:hypothetical protein